MAKSWRSLILDTVLTVIALFVAIALGAGPSETTWWPLAGPLSVAALGIYAWRGTHRSSSRHLGVFDILNVALATLIVAVLQAVIQAVSGVGNQIPDLYRVPIITWTFAFSGLIAARVAANFREIPGFGGTDAGAANTLIVGAGDAGEIVFRELNRGAEGGYRVVGFIDDDTEKHNLRIHGTPVLGGIDDIPALVKQHDIKEILIAIPSASGEVNRRIFKASSGTGARVRNLPSIAMLVYSERPMMPLMRAFQVEDLLRRAPVRTDSSRAKEYVGGERVLVTGGGGSIGSELVRQLAPLGPASLIVLGKGENSVFEIDRELRDSGIYQPTPVVCDVRDAQSLDMVFKQHLPRVVFHAAAHKHVPLMEANPIEAVRNNVFGTLNAAEASVRHGAHKFILVSTDKAVNPGNVMGATKRVAEMIVQSLAGRSETGMAIVRFGNVLGSRGSLVPILTRQIANGGPLTVTHPDMTRYFMTIPEAAQLIVQSGAFGNQGEIFILDMGQAVRIMELAEDLIRMHGLVPGQDIEIKITGIRPGEKIHEELTYADEPLEPLEDPRISRVQNTGRIDYQSLRAALDQLDKLCDEGNQDAVRAFLMELAWGRALPPVALD